MSRKLIVIGAGGFGREALDVIEAHNAAGEREPFEVLGVVDDAPSPRNLARLELRGYAHLGGIDDLFARFAPLRYVIGIGNPAVKRKLSRVLDARGWSAATVVHPSASIGSIAGIGDGSVICGGVQLSTNTMLGRHVHVNPNATIGHDSVLRDFVSVNPGAIVSGEVMVESSVLIGAGAVVLQGLTVGAEALVGASACVTHDVPASDVVVGVPARQHAVTVGAAS